MRGKTTNLSLIHDLQPLHQTVQASSLLRRSHVPIGLDDGVGGREQRDVGERPQGQKAVVGPPCSRDENVRVEENSIAHTRVGGSWRMLSGSSPSFRTSRRAAA